MTSISKNMLFDKLADVINKYNNTYYIATKMKPNDEISHTYIDLQKIMKSTLNLKLVNVYVPNWYEEAFVVEKKLLVILTVKKLLECITKKNCKRQLKQNLGWRK